MSRMFQIARREFVSTALTKGFIIGALVLPVVFGLCTPLIVRLISQAERAAPVVTGKLALIDHSGSGGELAERVRARLAPGDTGALSVDAIDPNDPLATVGAATGAKSKIELDVLDGEEAASAVRDDLRDAYSESMTDEYLALIEVPATAIAPAANGDDADGSGAMQFGEIEMYHRRKLDNRVIGTMRGAVVRSVRDLRFERADVDKALYDRLSDVETDTQEITETGEAQGSNVVAGIVLPIVLMVLLMIAVMTGGQYLLTTTIEEKQSRVVEVLLSGVSPMQLMFGKILGQMAVGMTLMTIYTGLGAGVLILALKITGLITVQMIIGLAVFYLLAYIMIAALMAAIGSAVNELREAQSLMTPVMLLVMVPYFLVLPISRAPNSTLSVVLSFIPPINPFVMVIRMGSTSPPPLWQVIASAAVGAVGAYLCVWFAAKVFRVGLLMFGKPPNLSTLIKWVRMA